MHLASDRNPRTSFSRSFHPQVVTRVPKRISCKKSNKKIDRKKSIRNLQPNGNQEKQNKQGSPFIYGTTIMTRVCGIMRENELHDYFLGFESGMMGEISARLVSRIRASRTEQSLVLYLELRGNEDDEYRA